LDGQWIIIFGEETYSIPLQPQNSLYVLDLINFEWYISKISGNIPSYRSFHKANIIGKYMVISFGNGIYSIIYKYFNFVVTICYLKHYLC